jgi:FixJ family two-component response regulator
MTNDSGRTVLIVDDDDSMREAIERLLNVAGFQTATYASAEALLAGGAVEGAKCVISDLKLPSMSGLELLTELGARRARLPMIVITAYDAPGVRDEAERRGAVAYFAKPFQGHELLAALETAIERYAGPATPK